MGSTNNHNETTFNHLIPSQPEYYPFKLLSVFCCTLQSKSPATDRPKWKLPCIRLSIGKTSNSSQKQLRISKFKIGTSHNCNLKIKIKFKFLTRGSKSY